MTTRTALPKRRSSGWVGRRVAHNLSQTQTELLFLLRAIPRLDVRTNGAQAILYDTYHFCNYDQTVRASTVNALIRAGWLVETGTDSMTGWKVYRRRDMI